jgi:hypothetical protein
MSHKTATETYSMLTDIYSETALSHPDIFELYKRKLGGLADKQNDPKYG